MKNLKKLAISCQRELESIGIKCGKVKNFSINTRAKKRWGQCKALENGEFEISISATLLYDNVDDMAVKNTIVHELLHTVPGCMKHTGKWKTLAETVNRRLKGYNIKRVTSSEEKGITVQDKKTPARYVLKCMNCGQCFYRQRMSKAVADCSKYRCSKCSGKLQRIV